jgi:hypothetical protein
MARKSKSGRGDKQVEALVHDEATRRNIPTVVSTRIVSGCVQFLGEEKPFLHSLDPLRKWSALRASAIDLRIVP